MYADAYTQAVAVWFKHIHWCLVVIQPVLLHRSLSLRWPETKWQQSPLRHWQSVTNVYHITVSGMSQATTTLYCIDLKCKASLYSTSTQLKLTYVTISTPVSMCDELVCVTTMLYTPRVNRFSQIVQLPVAQSTHCSEHWSQTTTTSRLGAGSGRVTVMTPWYFSLFRFLLTMVVHQPNHVLYPIGFKHVQHHPCWCVSLPMLAHSI